MKPIIRVRPGSQWSDAVVHGGTAYFVEVPESGTDIASQSIAVLAQAERTLETCGSSKHHLLMATIYIKQLEDRTIFNEVWENWLPAGCAPARCCISAQMTSNDYLLEIAFIAAVPAAED